MDYTHHISNFLHMLGGEDKDSVRSWRNHFSCIVRDDGQLIKWTSDACFAWIGRSNINKDRVDKILFYIQHTDRSVTTDVRARWIDWVVNHSVYAKEGVFYNSSDDILETGVVIVNTDIPSNVMYSGMQHLRLLYEHVGFVKYWNYLYEHGCSGELAFIASLFINKPEQYDTTRSYNNFMSLEHRPICQGYSNVETYYNYLHQNLINRKGNNKLEVKNIYGLYGGSKGTDHFAKDFIGTKFEFSEKKGPTKNPFSNVLAQNYNSEYEDVKLMPLVLAFAKEQLEPAINDYKG